MFPAGLPNLVVTEFVPEKKVYIFTQRVAVPWILVCAAANASSFLEAAPLRDPFFSVTKVSITTVQKDSILTCITVQILHKKAWAGLHLIVNNL